MFTIGSTPGRVRAILGGAFFALATLQYAVAQIVVAAAWNPAYSWSVNFISDLGNTACGQFAVHGATTFVCSPLHALMNGSFILSGVLTIAGTILLWRAWPERPLVSVALVLWLVAGVLKTLVGFFPENTVASLHLLGALNLPILSVAIGLLSIATWRSLRGIAAFGWVVAIVGLVGAVLSTAAQTAGPALTLGLGNGGMERIAGYPGNIWMLVVGCAVILANVRRGARLVPDARLAHVGSPASGEAG